MLWFSLLVLIPLAAVVVDGARRRAGPASGTPSPTRRRWRRCELTVVQVAARRPLVNVVMGTLIAWVLVRDHFPGKRRPRGRHRHPVRAADDRRRPGAARRSTGRSSPLGVNVANTRDGGLPRARCSSRCRSSCARCSRCSRSSTATSRRRPPRSAPSRFTTFRRIILPSLVPAIAAGAALSFARAISEYGSLVLLSGNLPMPHRGRLGAHPRPTSRTATWPAPPRSPTVLLVVALARDRRCSTCIQRRVARRG